MTVEPVCIQIDPHDMLHALQHEAVERLNHAEGEIILDFSSVIRIDAGVAMALQEVADLADAKSVKVVLSTVSVDVYKVLKLLRMAQRFSFLS